MKILSLLPVYYPAAQYGGFIFSTHNLNQALVKLGHKVEVFTTNAGNKTVPINKPTMIDGVKITYFSYNRFFDIFTSTGWHYAPKMARKMKKKLSKFDLIINNVVWSYPTLAAAHYCQKYNVPYVIIPNGALYPNVLHNQYLKKIIYFKIFVKKILDGAAAMIYSTQDEFLKTHRPLKIKAGATIISNGLNLDNFENLPTKNTLLRKYPYLKDKEIILYLGRITRGKGLDLLVKAFAKLTKERKDIVLMIVGNDQNNYLKKVKQMVREENIDEQTLFTGMLVGKEKLAAYRASNIFVLPSSGENFGMAVVEAMACGTPIVISDQVGICHEIKKKKAGIVVKCNKDGVYKGIKAVLNYPKSALKMTQKAKKIVENNYDINQAAKQLIEKLNKLIG